MSSTTWHRRKNMKGDVMRQEGNTYGVITLQSYLLDKLYDNFDVARECIAFIDRKRDENKKLP